MGRTAPQNRSIGTPPSQNPGQDASAGCNQMLHPSNHKISIVPRKSGPLMDFFGKIATPHPNELEVNTMVSTVLVFFPVIPQGPSSLAM